MPGGKEQKIRSLKRAAENCAKLTDMFKKKSRKEKSPEEASCKTSQNSQEPISTEKGAVIPQNSQTYTDAAVTTENVSDGSSAVTTENVSDGSSKKTNSRENYEPSTMAQDLKERESRSLPGEDVKPNQPRTFIYPKRKFGKEERAFLPAWYDRWTWLHYNEVK